MNTEVWLYVIGGLLLGSLLLHAGLLFMVGLVLLLVAASSRLWQRYCLVGLGYRRHLGQTRAFFGEEVPLVIEITNDKPLPLAWLDITDVVPGEGIHVQSGRLSPSHIQGRRFLSMLLPVRWYERIRRHYRVRCNRRGYHPFGPATLRTGDIFGFAVRELEVPGEDFLLVYPKVVSFERLRLPPHDPFGDVPLHQPWLFEDPLRTVGVREYRPGDSPRRLHWKATARAPNQQPQVKVFEPTTSFRLLVLLNVSTAAQNWSWQGYDPELLEAAITTAASVASWANERGFLIGLAANARGYRSAGALRLPPSRDPQQLMHILEALAMIVPMATMPFEALVEVEGHALVYGTTVVVVTAVASDELSRTLHGLQRAGHRPTVLLVSRDQPLVAQLESMPMHWIDVEDTR